MLKPLIYRLIRDVISKHPLVARFAASVMEAREERRVAAGRVVGVTSRFVRADPATLFRKADGAIDVDPQQFGRQTYILSNAQIPPDTVTAIGPHLTSLDGLTDDQIAQAVFYVYFTRDSDALPSLTRIVAAGGTFVPHHLFTKTEYRFVNARAFETLRETWTRAEEVSHLSLGIHENLCEAIELTKHLDGAYVEIGVYKGGSALTATNYIRRLMVETPNFRRPVWLLDTFDGFNYDEARTSADVGWADTHTVFGVEKTMQHVRQVVGKDDWITIEPHNICHADLPSGIDAIAVANIDVDLYEPTRDALQKCAAKMAVGGIMVCEDPTSTPRLYGAYLAMQQFLESSQGQDYLPLFKTGQYILVRLR